MRHRLVKSAVPGPVRPLHAALVVVLSAAAILLTAAAAADAAGGMKATMSLEGTCSIVVDATWSHPKPGQEHVELQAFDNSTGHIGPLVDRTIGPTDRAAVFSFPATSGGPDVWIAKAFLFDASNNLLANATSKKYTFSCTL